MKTPKGKKPVVGSLIYIKSSYYIDHGQDDFNGGICKIDQIQTSISAGKPTWFVSVKERPGHFYNYEILIEEQEINKKEHPERLKIRGHICPDVKGMDKINSIRSSIAQLSDDLRNKLVSMGCNIYLFKERDLRVFLRYKKELPLFIGINRYLDEYINEALKYE